MMIMIVIHILSKKQKQKKEKKRLLTWRFDEHPTGEVTSLVHGFIGPG